MTSNINLKQGLLLQNTPKSVLIGSSFSAGALKTNLNADILNSQNFPLNSSVQTTKPSTSISDAKIKVEGVLIPRFLTQEDLSAQYSEKDVINAGVNKKNTRIFIADDFLKKSVALGVGSKTRLATHGDCAAAIADEILHGKGDVVKINLAEASDPEGKKWQEKIQKSILKIIDDEAKAQGKTRDTVDLSHCTYSMSNGYFERTPGIDAIDKAVDLFTKQGGKVFIASANRFYNKYAENVKKSNIVDGSNSFIGSKVAINPVPWDDYNNGGFVNGKDVRSLRKKDASSQSIIAPSKLLTKVDRDGNVVFKNRMSPTGFSKFISADLTQPAPVAKTSTDGMEGTVPNKLVSGKELADFILHGNNMYNNALKNSKAGDKLNDEEGKEYDKLFALEYKNRFGSNAIISLEQYDKFQYITKEALNQTRYGSIHERILSCVPEGYKTGNVYVSMNQLVLKNCSPENYTAQLFIKDKNNTLKAVEPNDYNLTTGTSWATPYAAAIGAINQRKQVAIAKKRIS